MNITLNKTDSVDASITVDVVKADYVNEVENSLKDLRKNAVIAGFRKGMVPPSFLRQKYGKSILFEKINKLVSQSLSDYIQDNKLYMLGEPLPAEGYAPIDFDNQEDFVFTFDIGLAPVIDVQLTKEDRIPYYLIQVTDEMIDKQLKHFCAQFGNYEAVENVEEHDMAKGNLIELNENGEPKTDGLLVEKAVLMPMYMKDEEEKGKFLKAALHSSVVFNPYKAYEGKEVELASFFNVKKEEVINYTGDFLFEINEITRYKEAEVNQDLYDKVFGAGTVQSEEEFRERIKESLIQQLAPESDYKFILDVRNLLEEKASDMQLPDAFLRRWLLVSDSKRTPESIEKDYPKIAKDLKFQLIKDYLIKENGITVEESELLGYAKRAAHAQFLQYGMNTIPDDLLENYAQEMLKKEDTYRSLSDKAFEDKLIQIFKEQVTLDPQEISMEDFQKLIK